MTKYLPLFLAAASALLPPSVRAAAADGTVEFGRTELSLAATLSPAPDSIGSDYAVTYTPVLTSAAGDTLRLAPVTFRGKRNARLAERQRRFGELPEAAGPELPLGTEYRYAHTLPRSEAPALWRAGEVSLWFERERAGCCTAEPLAPLAGGCGRWTVPFSPVVADVPDFTGRAGQLQRDNPVLQHISRYRPYDSTRILRREEGALYVHFPLDKWTLLEDFRSNGPTLAAIVDITRQIMADTASMVKIIQIVGLASPEGPQKRNRLLADRRADELRRYIADRVPEAADSLFEVIGGGEAWTELRSQIEELDFDGRDELLEIIDTEPDPDRRERRIKALRRGRPYSYLRDNVLSDQRNSGYLRIYYDYVPDTAARRINDASALLRQGRYAEALPELRALSADPRSWNALAVALYMTGSGPEAIDLFRRAADRGSEQARANLAQLLEEDPGNFETQK